MILLVFCQHFLNFAYILSSRHLRVPYPESAYRACAAANKNLAISRTVMPIPVLLPPLSGTFGHRTGCLFGPNTIAMESSGVFGNPHQQLSGGSTNFGMLRNSRVQSGASPGVNDLFF